MNDVIFLSGWAGVPGLYPGLSRRARFLAPFLDGDETALIEAVLASRATILAGWSTGAHMIVKHADRLLPRFSRVVLLAPFLRFTDSFPARLVRSMIVRMERDPEGTSLDFWRACGFADPAAWRPEWAAPLTEGLRYLLTSEAPSLPVAAGHVTVLHGDADRIVRASAVAAAMAGLQDATRVSFHGGHSPSEAVLEPYLFP
jgi:predicted esterase